MLKLKLFVLFAIIFISTHLNALDPSRFYTILSEPTPKWMMEQIQHDLAPFKQELSRKFLDQIFNEDKETLCFVRVQSVNGELFVHKSNFASSHPVPDMIIRGLFQLRSLVPLPDFDLILTAHDTVWQYEGRPRPIFTEATSFDSVGPILIPDRFALKGYDPERPLVYQGNSLYPWEVKKPILFFRGSDTGVQFPWKTRSNIIYLKGISAGLQGGFPFDDKMWKTPPLNIMGKKLHQDLTFDKIIWKSFPRPTLVALSLQYPDLIDAKFVNTLSYYPIMETAVKEGFLGNFVPMKDQMQFRYLIDIDGNCASCPRPAALLHSNSVVFKQLTNSIQWYYGLLKPYKHYIPVVEDLSDLLIKLEWAKTHDEECRQMSENARKLAEEALSDERIYQYLYCLLQEYAKLQKKQYNL